MNKEELTEAITTIIQNNSWLYPMMNKLWCRRIAIEIVQLLEKLELCKLT